VNVKRLSLHIFFTALVLASVPVASQVSVTDSLRSALQRTTSDTSRLKILDLLAEDAPDAEWELYNDQIIELTTTRLLKKQPASLETFYRKYLAKGMNYRASQYYNKDSFDSAIVYYTKALELLTHINQKEGIATAVSDIGLMHHNKGDLKKALEHYEKSLKIYEETANLKGIARTLNNIGTVYHSMREISVALDYFKRSLKISETLGEKLFMAESFFGLGNIYDAQGDNPKAMDYYFKALEFYKKTKETGGEAVVYTNLSNIFYNQGDILKALDYSHKALKLQEEAGDKTEIANSLGNIGLIYKDQGDTLKMFEYWDKSLRLRMETGDKIGVASIYNFYATYYGTTRQLLKTLDYLNKSLALFEETDQTSGVGDVLTNLGTVYKRMGDLKTALNYYEKSCLLRKKINDKHGVAISLNKIADVYYRLKNNTKAKQNALEGFRLSKELGYPAEIGGAAKLLYLLYKQEGNGRLALEMRELYVQMKDSVDNAEIRKAGIQRQLQYDYEKKAVTDSTRNAELMVIEQLRHEEAINQQRFYTYSGAAGFAMMIVIAGISFKAYRNKQKANVMISYQKKLVEERQKEILDSIHYAKRIQTALIPSEKYIEKIFNRIRKD